MKSARALILSAFISVALTLLLRLISGTMVYGLFLFLPLGLFFARRRNVPPPGPDRHQRTNAPDSTPIEPR